MDKVKLHDLERLDIPDAAALQNLVYNYCARFIGGLLGQGNWTDSQAGFNRGGLFSKPTSPITHNVSGGVDGALTRIEAKLVISTKFVLYHNSTDNTDLSVSTSDPKEVEGHVLAVDPNNAQQQVKFDLMGAQDAFNSSGMHPYVWVRPVGYDSDTATRRKWSTTTGAEVATALKTRTRYVVEFAFQADNPGPEWCAIGRILFHAPTTVGTDGAKPEVKWFHWSDIEAWEGEVPAGLLGQRELYSDTSTGVPIRSETGQSMDGLINQLAQMRHQIANLFGSNPRAPEEDYWHHWQAGKFNSDPEPQGVLSLTRRAMELKSLWDAAGYAIESLEADPEFDWTTVVGGWSDGAYSMPVNVTAGLLDDMTGEPIFDSPQTEDGADGGLALRLQIQVQGGDVTATTFFAKHLPFVSGMGYGFMANQPGKTFTVTAAGFTAESVQHVDFINSGWTGTATVGTELRSKDKDLFDQRITTNATTVPVDMMPTVVFRAAPYYPGWSGSGDDPDINSVRTWTYSYMHKTNNVVRFFRAARGTYIVDLGTECDTVVATANLMNGAVSVYPLEPTTNLLNGTNATTGNLGPSSFVLQGQLPDTGVSNYNGATAPTQYWLVRCLFFEAPYEYYGTNMGASSLTDASRHENDDFITELQVDNESQEVKTNGHIFDGAENVTDAAFFLTAYSISSAGGGGIRKDNAKAEVEGDAVSGAGFGLAGSD